MKVTETDQLGGTVDETADTIVGYVDNLSKSILESIGVNHDWTIGIKFFIVLVVVLFLGLLFHYIVQKILQFVFKKLETTVPIAFIRYLNPNKVPALLAIVVPYSFLRTATAILFHDMPTLIRPAVKFIDVCFVFFIIQTIMAVLKSFTDGLSEKPAFKDKPMKSYLQVIQIILYVFGFVGIFCIITSTSPIAVFTAMGAASAVMMLMFKDSIMGFVSSVQLTTNDMVKLGDWITMNKFGADGNVIDISLTTVKIQNFDKTITTIPTYALIADSFQNWRGMQDAGGRRFKKSIYIKQNTIRFINEDELAKFKEVDLLKPFIEMKETEYNKRNANKNTSIPIGTHKLSNNELFIAYMTAYVTDHPRVQKEYTMLVRQMLPTPNGMEVEIYAFSDTAVWAEYEAISTEIFNHAICSAAFFGLEMFENGSATDTYPVMMLGK